MAAVLSVEDFSTNKYSDRASKDHVKWIWFYQAYHLQRDVFKGVSLPKSINTIYLQVWRFKAELNWNKRRNLRVSGEKVAAFWSSG